MVIRGGENIYPTEIENFLHTHPKVQDVQVSKYRELEGFQFDQILSNDFFSSNSILYQINSCIFESPSDVHSQLKVLKGLFSVVFGDFLGLSHPSLFTHNFLPTDFDRQTTLTLALTQFAGCFKIDTWTILCSKNLCFCNFKSFCF